MSSFVNQQPGMCSPMGLFHSLKWLVGWLGGYPRGPWTKSNSWFASCTSRITEPWRWYHQEIRSQDAGREFQCVCIHICRHIYIHIHIYLTKYNMRFAYILICINIDWQIYRWRSQQKKVCSLSEGFSKEVHGLEPQPCVTVCHADEPMSRRLTLGWRHKWQFNTMNHDDPSRSSMTWLY